MLAHKAWHTKRLIYDAGKTILSAPGAYDIDLVYKKVQEETAHWMETATHLKNSVEYFKKARQYKIGAFMLHQAAEQSLMAIIRLSTGYRAGTHNLWRLLRYAQVFGDLPFGMFNSSPGKEKALLRILQSAYIGGRYKNDFELSEHQFLILEEGIESLLNNIQKAIIKLHPGS
jgi:HEPN domain-containing protein